MKIEARRLPQVLRSLPQLRVICLHGDDAELIRDTARRLVTAAAGSLDDPFRISVNEDGREDSITIALASPPLTGGRAVTWVRHGSERLAAVTARTLALETTALLLLEYADAGQTSKVRRAVEASSHGCAISCYGSDEALREGVQSALEVLGTRAESEAIRRLAAWAAASRQSVQQVAELAWLAGAGAAVDARSVEELAGSSATGGGVESRIGEALGRGLTGEAGALDATVETLLVDETAVGIVRAGLAYLQRLRRLGVAMGQGRSLMEVGRTLRPPLFAREQSSVATILRHWTPQRVHAAAATLWRAERLCKRNGVPADAIARAALARLARGGPRSPPL